MRLEIQKFLDEGGITEAGTHFLQESYGIYAKRHPEFPNLVQFAYDQIETPNDKRASKVVRECRGIILDEADNWKVVAYPFNRFFNADEPCADEIDWKHCRVQEKVDGSLMILYHYKDDWHVATKGSPDAGGNVGDLTITFRKLFWDSAEYFIGGLCKSGCLNTNYTYMVELTSPANRIVCDYTKRGPIDMVDGDANIVRDPTFIMDQTGLAMDGSRLTLIGVRDISSPNYKEIPVDNFRDDWHYVVQEFPLRSLDDVVAAAACLNPIEQEGYVVVDENFNRIKIKSPTYVLIHHIKDSFTIRRQIELIKAGEDPEVLAYYPEYQEQMSNLRIAIAAFAEVVQGEYDRVTAEVGPDATQKDFALKAKATKLPAALFAIRSGRCKTAREFVMTMPADKIATLIRGKHEVEE